MNREPIILRKLGQDRRVAITQETIIFFPMGHHRGTLVTTYILFDVERGGEMRQIKSERRASFFSPHLRERERERERETLSSSLLLRGTMPKFTLVVGVL